MLHSLTDLIITLSQKNSQERTYIDVVSIHTSARRPSRGQAIMFRLDHYPGRPRTLCSRRKGSGRTTLQVDKAKPGHGCG